LQSSPADAARILEKLCRDYWLPIYATLRRTGHARHDAEDLTQGFFAELLRDSTLHQARPERGRLRSFLLGALRRFVADGVRHRLSQKRGGGAVHLAVEAGSVEAGLLADLRDEQDPEKIYAAAWAQALLDRVRAAMRAGFAEREALYTVLEPVIEGEETRLPFCELASLLGQSESGARVTIFRLRQRFRELLTEAVRLTVTTPDEVPEELEWVQATLAGRIKR
jgi:RNA polymerase sigma-70 factor (ECF subfamily)